jgi:hypothetical protein
MDKPLSKLEQQRANAEATRKAKNSRIPVPRYDLAAQVNKLGADSLLPPEKPKAFRKPLAKDAHKTLMATKPWEKEGLSRRTWYRRQKEIKK